MGLKINPRFLDLTLDHSEQIPYCLLVASYSDSLARFNLTISPERLAAGRARMVARKVAREARITRGEFTRTELNVAHACELFALENAPTVRQYRSHMSSKGRVWSFHTVDHTGRTHLQVLAMFEDGSIKARVVNASQGYTRIDCDVPTMVKAVTVWAANAARRA